MSRVAPPTEAQLGEVAALTPEDPAAGFVGELRESTDEVLRTHGGGDLATYEKLLRDYQVQSTFQQRRSAVCARETRVDPGGPSELDALAADSLRAQLRAIPFDRITRRMLAAVMYGYAVGEPMWGVDAEGRVTMTDIRVRRASRFRWSKDGKLRLMRAGEPVALPDRKFWTVTFGAEDDDDPYGKGLGHWLYWPVWLKRNAVRFWALFLERFATGTPYAKVPVGTNKADMDKVLGILEKVVRGGRIVIPQNVVLETLQNARDSGGDYSRFVELQDASISKIVLSQTMTTDDGASLSQSKTHADVATAIAVDDASMVCESFAASVGRWLTEWNFPGARPPLVYRDFSQADDLTALADRDTKISMVGYRPTAERIAEVYGDGYESAPSPQAAAPAAAAFAEPLPGGSTVAQELAATGWRQVMGPEVDAIERLLDGANSLEEVRKRLGDLYIERPEAMTEALARIMFSGRVLGEADGPLELDDEAELG